MTFEYKALKPDGTVITGEVDSSSRAEAMSRLKGEGMTLLDLTPKETSSPTASNSLGLMPTLEFNRIRPAQLAFLFRQLGELVDAGFPIVSAVESLQRFCGHDKTKKLLTDVASRIRAGQGFAEALAAQEGVFTRIQLALVKIGESSGTLDEVLRRTADLIEAQLELRGKIRSALTYPCFILIFSAVLCWSLVTFLLPVFEPIWKGSNVDLSHYPVTQFLIWVSHITRNPIDELFLILLITGIATVFRRLSTTPEGQDTIGSFLLKIPLLGNYLQLSETAEISSTLSSLLESGVPLVSAVELTSETVGNAVIANALKNAAQNLRAGNDLSSSLDHSDTFPELFVQMVAVGESTGDLPAMLGKVARYYRRQLDDSLKSLTSLLEPMMMVLIGGVVFVFVLGVFLPIMGIVSALSGGAH